MPLQLQVSTFIPLISVNASVLHDIFSAPSDVVGVMASRVSENSFVLEWGKPHYPNGIIQEYEIVIEHVIDASSSKLANEMRYRYNKTNERQMTVTGLQSAELYAAKVCCGYACSVG